MDDFVWRVSIAEVRSAGPFSDFRDVDRILSVLDGELALTIANGPERRLTPSDPPFPFPADVPTHGAPLDGDVRDLNVMVRRQACRATVERLAGGTAHLGTDSETFLMIIATGDATVTHGADSETLRPYEAVLFDAPIPRSITVRSAAASFAIRLTLVG